MVLGEKHGTNYLPCTKKVFIYQYYDYRALYLYTDSCCAVFL